MASTAAVTTTATAPAAESTAAAVDDNMGDERIEKAVKFWKHPSVASVSSKEKVAYLTSKGLSESDIHQVWEALVQDEPAPVAPPPGPIVPPRTTAATRDDQYYYEDEGGVPPQKNLALLAVGSMVGLSAAAAVRWLNGGDFAIFPPALTASSSSTNTTNRETITTARNETQGATDGQQQEQQQQQQEQQQQANQQHNNTHDDEDDYEYVYEDEDQQNSVVVNDLSLKMEALTELVKFQSETQNQILKQLTTQQTKQVTDQSMALLRSSNGDKRNSADSLLIDIKGLLERLQDQQSSQKIANEALEKLNEYMRLIEDKEDRHRNNDSPHQNNVQTTHASPHATSSTTTYSNSSRTSTQNSNPSPTEPTSNSNVLNPTVLLHQVVQRLALENEDRDALQSGCQVLYLYVVHLSSHPHVPRYRKIYTSNGSFQRVEQLIGGVELLQAVGFVESGGYLEWQPTNESEALQMLKEASAALSILKTAGTATGNKEELSQTALATLPALPAAAVTSATPTPPDNNSHNDNDDDDDDMDDDEMMQLLGDHGGVKRHDVEPWQTPRTPHTGNFLISPPNTKRESFLPTPRGSDDDDDCFRSPDALPEAETTTSSMLDLSFDDGSLLQISSPATKLIFDRNPSPVSGSSTTAFQPIAPKMQLLARRSGDEEELLNTSVVQPVLSDHELNGGNKNDNT